MKRLRIIPGFSLVETLVAMFIFILAVGVLSQATANALEAIATMEVREGSETNFQFIREVVLTISDTDSLGLGGDVMTPTGGQGHWDVETETTNTPDYFQVKLTMNISGNGSIKPESATEELYTLRPQWSQTDQRSALQSTIHDNLPNYRTQQNWP